MKPGWGDPNYVPEDWGDWFEKKLPEAFVLGLGALAGMGLKLTHSTPDMPKSFKDKLDISAALFFLPAIQILISELIVNLPQELN